MTTPTPTLGSPDLLADAHRHHATDVAAALGVDLADGLDPAVASRRLDEHGRNELAEAPRRAWWRRFAAQFGERLVLILLAAAVIAFVVSGELKTPLVVLAVVLVNALIGVVQEGRAERSLDALRRMVVAQARVRRGGESVIVPAAELVPGDVVLVEAGDRVPADGRLTTAVTLEIDESALTGESQPVAKSSAPLDSPSTALGDRTSMAYLNSTVTRGRGELVVTATGMRTEIGRIAGLLRATEVERSPLQRQLDRLAHSLARLAGLIVVAVAVIGFARGESLDEVLLTAVALAVAAIPEGLPAVTAVTLAIGVSQLARRNAIVKRLASVETLGCTSVICSDKTGTLTLNEMTAVELVVGLDAHLVSGRGYGPVGEIAPPWSGAPDVWQDALEAMVLCNDAEIRRDEDTWQLVGDPTEGALVTLAAKAGIDVGRVRRERPRVAEIAFDSARKWMATVHRRDDGTLRLIVKGAPDALVAMSATALAADGARVPIRARRSQLDRAIDAMAGRGERVLAVAWRDLGAGDVAEALGDDDARLAAVRDLTMVALVGILDPPRPEVAAAIAEARDAGVAVKMITGDHAVTAGAIARQLGLEGATVSGADLDAFTDEELDERLPRTAVFARVSPEHKLRLVEAFQRNGNVVAMTGDGVNDAPALKQADIGVAMGITGTEVTKEAATAILADDNFATIVGAVRRGRAIYDNIVAFVRFQLSTTVGFAALFLGAGLFGIADGQPFTAIAILWVNLVMDGPPAMALGLDPPAGDVMRRRPRPPAERILTRARGTAVGLAAAVMAAGTLAVLAWAPGPEPGAGTATVAGTMAFTTFVLFQVVNAFNARSDRRSVFSRDTLRNRWLWASLTVVVALQVAVTALAPLQDLFDTTSLSAGQWLVCTLVASSVLWCEELRKALVRSREEDDR